jgi:type VI secretion system secreted protein VgrG
MAKSPTLTKNVEALKKNGWTIEYGDAGKGSYTDKTKKRIVVDSNAKNSPTAAAQTLAHESGHALYTADPYVTPTGKTKDEYVKANVKRDLKDEGEATLTNVQVRNEVKENGGPDIGVAGTQAKKYEEIAAKYPEAKDRDKAREEIGSAFAKGEHPSNAPSQTYEDYYAKTYADHYDKTVKPTKGP